MTDVRLFHTVDGGEIDYTEDGRFVLDDSPATAAYLSLFGGNERDGGGASTERLQWWGNLTEGVEVRHLRSETQHLLRSLAAVTSNLRRIEDVVGRDLAWMTNELGAKVEVQASMPAVRRVDLDITIEIDGTTTELRFLAPWGPE